MQAWESFLRTLQKQLGEEVVTKWLLPLKVVHFDAWNLYLEAQNSFQIEWFEEHVRSRAKKEFVTKNARPIRIHLTSAESTSAKEKKNHKNSLTPQGVLPPSFTLIKDSLLEEMTEDTFLFSESNPMLQALMRNMTTSPLQQMFNPIVFYGAPCTGKTHILQALTQAFHQKNLKALYVRAETFTENVIGAIRTGHMQDFRKAHRHIDILLFDDIQYLAKKAATQEEFFHTFNALHTQGKLIVLSSDTPPALLHDIEPRLISRFEWGLTLPIQKLDKKELLQMLKMRCKHLQFPLSDSTCKFLIDTFTSTIKSLQRSLDALILRTSSSKKQLPISPSVASTLLKDLIEVEQTTQLSLERIVLYIAEFFHLNPEDILGRSQTQECTLPRQMAMFLCRELLKTPFSRIGDHFKRDHSTVMTSVKAIEEKIKRQDKDVISSLLLIKQKIQQGTLYEENGGKTSLAEKDLKS